MRWKYSSVIQILQKTRHLIPVKRNAANATTRWLVLCQLTELEAEAEAEARSQKLKLKQRQRQHPPVITYVNMISGLCNWAHNQWRVCSRTLRFAWQMNVTTLLKDARYIQRRHKFTLFDTYICIHEFYY